jgi:hypothetical protein
LTHAELPKDTERSSTGFPGWLFVILILVGVGLRLAYVHRPFDHRLENPWRQSDYLQVARNFQDDGMNILYPRIDWRRDTPGFAEMELPLLPWMGALLFEVFGARVQILRGLAATFEIAALVLFAGFARRMLAPRGALFATACFALNPILIISASSPQPDPVMHLFSLAAVVFAWSWYCNPAFARLLAAAAFAGLAILAKLPALYLGLLFAYLVIRKRGIRGLGDYRVWVAALVATVPAIAWYSWSHRFWLLYGNSLGVSNETHAIGWDMLLPPRFVLGLVKWELLGVFSPIGWVLALAALRKPRAVELPLVWYGSVLVFYVLTARTSADDWSYYYHFISVAPACLLMGAGLDAFTGPGSSGTTRWWRWRQWLGAALVVACLAALLGYAGLRIHRRDSHNYAEALYRCVVEFREHVPADGRIVVRGGIMFDRYGRPVAHNESMAFAWINRRGFNYADEQLSLETLDYIARRGGRYWIAGESELRAAGLVDSVRSRYGLLARCHQVDTEYLLYDLLSDENTVPDDRPE